MMIRSVAAAVVGITLVAVPALAGPNRRPAGVNAREHRQAQRIHEGVKSGELTRGEANRLRADEAATRAKERVYRQSGGGLTRGERRDLERDLNHDSRAIYRAKHNDRTR